VPTAFRGSKRVRGGIKRREYQVKARYQVRANALLALQEGSPNSRRAQALASTGQPCARSMLHHSRNSNILCGTCPLYNYHPTAVERRPWPPLGSRAPGGACSTTAEKAASFAILVLYITITQQPSSADPGLRWAAVRPEHAPLPPKRYCRPAASHGSP